MTWAQSQRQAFIGRRLKDYGKLNRRDLMEEFDISTPQASADIARYQAAHPGAMTYDKSEKCYVRGACPHGHFVIFNTCGPCSKGRRESVANATPAGHQG